MNIKIIAEIGQAHDGSLGMAHAYIDALAKSGVDIIKFQTHIAEAESSAFEPFRVQFSTQDATRFDYWKRMEFSLDQWKELKAHCDDLKVEFMSSPFSNAAVDLLEEVGVKCYKVGSGEVSNFLLLEKIARTGKPIILSSGLSSYEELDQAVTFLKEHDCDISLMQCTTSYPTQPSEYGLNIIPVLSSRYNLPVGFSDHSGKPETSIAAAVLGAQLIEFHAVFDRAQFGPDVTSSITIDEISQLVPAIRTIEDARNNPVISKENDALVGLKSIFEKSLSVNKNLKQGHVLTFEDLEAKKPANRGIAAKNFTSVIGKQLLRDMTQWSFLSEECIYEK